MLSRIQAFPCAFITAMVCAVALSIGIIYSGPTAVQAATKPADEYVPGSSEISLLELQPVASEVPNNSNITFKANTALQVLPESQFTSFEHTQVTHTFTVPAATPSGGRIRLNLDVLKRWLKDVKERLYKGSDGLTYHEVTGIENREGANSGVTTNDVVVNVGTAISGESVNLQQSAFITLDGPTSVKSTEAKVVVKSKVDNVFDLRFGGDNNIGYRVSGWYNPETGAYSVTKPQDDPQAVYGSFYNVVSYFWRVCCLFG